LLQNISSVLNLVYLVIAGFVAGIFNTLSGGGSLLTLPLLIFLGLPPNVANGTNRVAIFIQSIFGSAGYQSKGYNTYPINIYLGLAALFGAIIGAKFAIDIKGDIFNKILAIVMIIVVVFLVFTPKNFENKKEKINGKHLWLSILVFFVIGIYAGFIQAGTGFFILLALTKINNMSLLRSNATKTVVVLIYTISALATFTYYGKVNWQYGLSLALGAAIGAWFASRWSVKKGDKKIPFFLITAVTIMAVKLWFFS
jgi:uncharacterized membrane protein YfcA